jgi:hypothetical protein
MNKYLFIIPFQYKINNNRINLIIVSRNICNVTSEKEGEEYSENGFI